MSIPGAGNPLLLGGAAGGYKIERSLRFNSADTAYLRRTPTSAGNRKTWTWSGWVKRCEFGASLQQVLLGSMVAGGDPQTMIGFLYDNIDVFYYQSGTYYRSNSVAVIRDSSAWYHIVYAIDTTQASASDRCKVYVNGAQITMSAWTVPQNTDMLINAASQLHDIGTLDGGNYYKFNGYLADVHFIDGQALTPSSFGETDINGIWQPKAYSGSYGTNGFQLKFADNSAATATTLGKDTSGNGNNWTPNNLSVTAGAGNDSLVDSPTNYGTDTGAGGEVRGNYCTLNPLDNGGLTLSNGNLQYDRATASWLSCRATFGMSSGKWYWEATITAGTNMMIGISKSNAAQSAGNYVGADASGWGYNNSDGLKYNNGGGSAYGNTYTATDVVGVSFDADSGDLKFYKNGVAQNSGTSAFTGLTSGPYFPAVSLTNTTTAIINFGQRQWAYAAPAGFKALCTQNLSAPTITKPSSVMDALTWTGTSANQTVSGLNFNPDLIWIKIRSDAKNHAIQDSVRGFTTLSKLSSSGNFAEGDTTNLPDWAGYVNGSTSTGFTLTKNGTGADDWVHTNKTGNTYVGWCWDAGSTTVTNTSGTISSQVRANASAGFSIVTYTGNGNASESVGHGLGVKPGMILYKQRNNTSVGIVWHQSLAASNYLAISLTASTQPYGSDLTPSGTSTFKANTSGSSDYSTNVLSSNYVAYCFAPVAGYSAFGSYTGNGSADGPFVYTGFRPRWVMVKCAGTASNWFVYDTARDVDNVVEYKLYPNDSAAENGVAGETLSTNVVDILSNGFKLRNTNGSNFSAQQYIYAAFAENPFQYARAR